MTQAFNLSQLANKVNTSGQLDASTGLVNTVPVANGGTGVTASGASGNILVSNGTAWVSQAPSGGGVTSLNGQTGVVVTTDLGAIGSVGQFIYATTGTSTLNTTLFVSGNTTIAGSSLRYDVGTTPVYSGTTPVTVFQQSNPNYASGGTALSGTWRVMQKSAYFYNANQGGGNYACNWSQILVMRIS